MRIIVPGNLLLFGEYAVACPEGLGIAVATKEKLTVNITPSAQFKLTGRYGHHEYEWIQGSGNYPSPLLEYILKQLNTFPNQHIHIDSSEFYYPDGTKKGFGSSAAATVGLAYALKYEELFSKEELIKLALRLHQSFQKGKGSGYDIFTSVHGGAGLFTKKPFPSWKPLNQDLYSNFYLIRGNGSCNTQSSLQELENFALKNPAELRKFLSVSNRLVGKLATSLRLFSLAAKLNIRMNTRLSQNLSWKSSSIKALGAGGEIGITLDPSLSLHPLQISSQGVQCLS